MLLSLFLVTLTLSQAPTDAGAGASAASAPPAADVAPVADVAPAAEVAPAETSTDSEPPLIEDIAAASANPATAPVVTVMMSDRGSGVGDAAVVYRAAGASAWERVPLVGGSQDGSSLFIARLPDGLQRSGFAYYVEASDRAGNGPVRIGSAEEPIVVDKASEPTRARLEREAIAQTAPEPLRVPPAFIMLGYGVGILGTAGAAGYLIDLGISQRRLETVEDELTTSDLTDARRRALTRAAAGYENAIIYDTAISAVLGVVGVAGLVTGTALLIATNLE
jgi:hypothetical protein